MNKFYSLLLVAFLAFGVVGTSFANPVFNSDNDSKHNSEQVIQSLIADGVDAVSKAEWKTFSSNLVDALKSSHGALQQAAMRLVIQYGNQVDVEDAVFDVMRIYRDGDKDNVRRMAVVTLANMESDWAIDFLARSERFEKSDQVRQTINAVLTQSEVS